MTRFDRLNPARASRSTVQTRVEDVRPGDVIVKDGMRVTVGSRPRRVSANLVGFGITNGPHPGEWLDRPGTLLTVIPVERGPYELAVDHIVFATGSLVAMFREAHGCAGARIYRAGGDRPIVRRAGSDTAPEFVRWDNTTRVLRRRKTRHTAA